MKKTVLFLTANIIFLSSATLASAQYAPYQPGTTSLSILVDKKVGNTIINKGNTTVEYVDNLSENDHKFSANEDIWFQVKVKNTANTKLTGVTLKDFLPSYIMPVEGPGSYDSGNRVLTVNAGDFEINEEKTYTFKMRVMASDSLQNGVNCIMNKAQAYNNNVSDDDTAQVCIEKETGTTTDKGGTPVVTKIPSTGPEQGVLLYALSTLAAFAGLKLRKNK